MQLAFLDTILSLYICIYFGCLHQKATMSQTEELVFLICETWLVLCRSAPHEIVLCAFLFVFCSVVLNPSVSVSPSSSLLSPAKTRYRVDLNAVSSC